MSRFRKSVHRSSEKSGERKNRGRVSLQGLLRMLLITELSKKKRKKSLYYFVQLQNCTSVFYSYLVTLSVCSEITGCLLVRVGVEVRKIKSNTN